MQKLVIHGVGPSQVIIAGLTPYGTEFGVCEYRNPPAAVFSRVGQ